MILSKFKPPEPFVPVRVHQRFTIELGSQGQPLGTDFSGFHVAPGRLFGE
jgi:hypothetical protein